MARMHIPLNPDAKLRINTKEHKCFRVSLSLFFYFHFNQSLILILSADVPFSHIYNHNTLTINAINHLHFIKNQLEVTAYLPAQHPQLALIPFMERRAPARRASNV